MAEGFDILEQIDSALTESKAVQHEAIQVLDLDGVPELDEMLHKIGARVTRGRIVNVGKEQ